LSKASKNDGLEVRRDGGPDMPQLEHRLIEAKWLLKAGAASVLAAGLLAYAAFCLMFYQGQWQIVLHPGPMLHVPESALPPHEDVHFAFTESGQPTLYGWWIPADKGARMESYVVLYFPSGSDSLSSRTRQLTLLHQQRITVFSFDYRGYGNSAKLHPDEQSLEQDAISAVKYVTDTRHVPASHIVFLGESLGSLPALYAADQTPGVAAMILVDPRVTQAAVFAADSRTHLLPLHLLLRSDYSTAKLLPQFKAPTLVISTSGTQQGEQEARRVMALLTSKKSMLTVPNGGKAIVLTQQIDDFLDSVFDTARATPASSGSGSAPAPSQGK
jgi:pimeloyl-ACP methyl ester carboxylesterase